MIKNILSAVFFTFLTFNFLAQTSYSVNATPNSVFSPANLTINVGDTVIWTNIGGTHNVNGTQATFSSNPASFDNGSASSSAWTYQFVFTMAGTYNYQCDVHVGSGMTGTITVSSPTSINESRLNGNVSVYPNPFSTNLTVEIDKEVLNNSVEVEFILFDLLGNQVQRINRITSVLTDINTNELSHGIYIYSFKSNGRVLKTGKLTNN